MPVVIPHGVQQFRVQVRLPIHNIQEQLDPLPPDFSYYEK